MPLPRIRSPGGGPKPSGAEDSLTPTEVKLLTDINEHGETWGYHLSEEHGWQRSTVSKSLKSLEEKGFCSSTWEERERNKRKYKLTPAGLIVKERYHAVVRSERPARIEVIRESSQDGSFPTTHVEDVKGALINVGGGTARLTLGSYVYTMGPGAAVTLRAMPPEILAEPVSGTPVLYGSPSPGGPLFRLMYVKQNT